MNKYIKQLSLFILLTSCMEHIMWQAWAYGLRVLQILVLNAVR